MEISGEKVFECPSRLANSTDPMVKRIWAAYSDRERGHWQPDLWNSAIVEGVRYLDSIRGEMDLEQYKSVKRQQAKAKAAPHG